MEKAVAYLRVSTVDQVNNGLSLEAQEQAIKNYCELNKLNLIAVIRDEGVSGAIPLEEREGGKELIKILAKREANHVVAVKLDRLFRNAIDAMTTVQKWDEKGIALHLVDLGGFSVSSRSAFGRFFLLMLVAFAELERNMIAERTAAVLRHKKTRLEAYSSTPYGFRRVGDRLIIDPEEMEVVKQIFAWRQEGWSLRKIAEELTKRGIPPKKAKDKAPEPVSQTEEKQEEKRRVVIKVAAPAELIVETYPAQVHIWQHTSIKRILEKENFYKEVLTNV